jgi:hypothetical protein
MLVAMLRALAPRRPLPLTAAAAAAALVRVISDVARIAWTDAMLGAERL